MLKNNKAKLLALPGLIASLLMIIFTSYWTFWGAEEMYHEGWWGAWYHCLPYLAPMALTLIPSLVAFRWPLVGGSLVSGLGMFAFFFFGSDVSWIGLGISFFGLAFLADGLIKRRNASKESSPPASWWRRNWRYALLVGVPAAILIAVSVQRLPFVLTRIDDGDRSTRLIEGNGVALVWAPLGPGWNWEQEWGGYPSWNSIAVYGVAPVGLDEKPGYGKQEDGSIVFASQEDMDRTNLCRYLSADGLTLLDEPQDIWRMPTTDEIVRSLGRHGENAGCEWQSEFRTQVQCDIQPDKESPLWATDVPVIYYWTADSFNEKQGYFVAYNGTVNASYKMGGNPRHGYRCVREP